MLQSPKTEVKKINSKQVVEAYNPYNVKKPPQICCGNYYRTPEIKL